MISIMATILVLVTSIGFLVPKAANANSVFIL
jgi:hypothetical protein